MLSNPLLEVLQFTDGQLENQSGMLDFKIKDLTPLLTPLPLPRKKVVRQRQVCLTRDRVEDHIARVERDKVPAFGSGDQGHAQFLGEFKTHMRGPVSGDQHRDTHQR
jgi:hypothetical protein